jgi:hypothetical protein
MRDAFAIVVTCLVAWPSLGSCEDSRDRLIVAAGYQDLPDSTGNSVGADFVRSSAARMLSFGAETVSVADSHWSVVRGSAYRQLRGGADLLGSAAIGPGSTNGESFTYERLQLGGTIPVTDEWRLVARDTFVDVEPIRGQVLTLGGNRRRGSTIMQFDVSHAVGGNIEQRSVGFRIDGRMRKSTVFVGGLVGDTNNRLLFNEVGLALSDMKLRQAYAGMTLMLGKCDVTMTVDSATSGGVRRQSIGAIVGIPLASR